MLPGILNAIKLQAESKRYKERCLLEQIAEATDFQTATKAADIFAVEKNTYSFDVYLQKLQDLLTVSLAGVPPEMSIKAIEGGISANHIMNIIGRN
jgi:hypothetical protein